MGKSLLLTITVSRPLFHSKHTAQRSWLGPWLWPLDLCTSLGGMCGGCSQVPDSIQREPPLHQRASQQDSHCSEGERGVYWEEGQSCPKWSTCTLKASLKYDVSVMFTMSTRYTLKVSLLVLYQIMIVTIRVFSHIIIIMVSMCIFLKYTSPVMQVYIGIRGPWYQY